MIKDRAILKHNAGMAKHANDAVLFMGALVGGRYATKVQAREAMNFLLASTKRNIEKRCPNASRLEKDTEICRKVFYGYS